MEGSILKSTVELWREGGVTWVGVLERYDLSEPYQRGIWCACQLYADETERLVLTDSLLAGYSGGPAEDSAAQSSAEGPGHTVPVAGEGLLGSEGHWRAWRFRRCYELELELWSLDDWRRGERKLEAFEAYEAAQAVAEALFSPPNTPGYYIPEAFWASGTAPPEGTSRWDLPGEAPAMLQGTLAPVARLVRLGLGELVSQSTVARRWGLSRAGAKYRIDQEGIPVVRVGDSVLVREDLVELHQPAPKGVPGPGRERDHEEAGGFAGQASGAGGEGREGRRDDPPCPGRPAIIDEERWLLERLRQPGERSHDQGGFLLRIEAGGGGADALDWAEMLLSMYRSWAERRGLSWRLRNLKAGPEVGVEVAEVEVGGPFACELLLGERGVHRLVRISPFDPAGRRHTSFAAVSVGRPGGDPSSSSEAQTTTAPDTLGESSQEVRSYVLHPYRFVEDRFSGERSGDPGGVLAGGLDPFILAALRARVRSHEESGGEPGEEG